MVALHRHQPAPIPYRRTRRIYDGARIRIIPRDILPRVRVDQLPDRATYTDTGCAFFPSCLRCPLARCIEEEPVRYTPHQLTAARRDREIALLRTKHHAPIDKLAQYYGLTHRQIFRILKQQARSL